ncbi:MBL fold metallo-hydrolase [Amycolatopsis panacis]|nr:MBL fold metallo-hydrolase [Amycolatopsis panacis]
MTALPRRLGPGLYWLGDCIKTQHAGRTYHAYNSVYIVSGEDRSVLVETGFPADLPMLGRQIDELLASGAVAPLEYLFVTHQETPHAGGLGRFLEKFPDAVAVGGVEDLDQIFPRHAERLHLVGTSAEFDLGGRSFRITPGVIRDLITTYWGFDTLTRALFPGDGFAYSHFHEEGHCGLVAEEAATLDVPAMTALFAEFALHWTRFTDVEPYLVELDRLIADLDVTLVGPTHGLPITSLPQTLPLVKRGFRAGADA